MTRRLNTGLHVCMASMLMWYDPAGRPMSEDDCFPGSATAPGVIHESSHVWAAMLRATNTPWRRYLQQFDRDILSEHQCCVNGRCYTTINQ